jgi:uncharacterized Zn finger protein
VSWRDWEDWGYSAPRRPANGIRARTQRGKFGATWWAGRWLAALERLVDPGRLSRGRSYARSGQVTKLDISDAGVAAEVQGSRPYPYDVTIRFRRLTDSQWDAVADALASEALFAARLLNGEMPENVEDAFSAAGASLFPDAEDDLESECTCPDWSNPCKHVAAVFYLLGERFDDDPFLAMVLRGRTKEQLVDALRTRRAADGAADVDVPTAAGAPDEDPDVSLDRSEPLLLDADAPRSTADVAASFWTAPPGQADVASQVFAFRLPPVDALPAKLRGAPPQWPGGTTTFIPDAERAYRTIAERARRLATEGA